jgi:hypothetical protein
MDRACFLIESGLPIVGTDCFPIHSWTSQTRNAT